MNRCFTILSMTPVLFGAVTDSAQAADGVTIAGRVSAAFSPDSRRLVTISGKNPGYTDQIKIWECSTGNLLLAIQDKIGIAQVAFSPDGKRIYSSGNDKAVKCWDAANGKKSQTYGPHIGEVRRFILSPNRQRLYALTYDNSRPQGANQLKCWDVNSAEELFAIQSGSDDVSAMQLAIQKKRKNAGGVVPMISNGIIQMQHLALSSDGKLLAARFEPASDLIGAKLDPTKATRESRTIKVWDAATGKEVLSLPCTGNPWLPIAFSPDSRRLGAIMRSSTKSPLTFWELKSGNAESGPLSLDNGEFRILAFSPDGAHVAISTSRAISVIDAVGARELHGFKTSSNINGLAFSSNGKLLAAACGDSNEIFGSIGKVKVWDAASGNLVASHGHIRGRVAQVIFSSDGKRLAAVNEVGVTLWELPK